MLKFLSSQPRNMIEICLFENLFSQIWPQLLINSFFFVILKISIYIGPFTDAAYKKSHYLESYGYSKFGCWFKGKKLQPNLREQVLFLF